MPTALLLSALAASGPHRPKIAVVDFDPVGAELAPQAKLLSQVSVTEVLATHQFDVISSADVRNLLGLGRQRQLLGCKDDSSCLAEIGGALGVDYLITGQLGRQGAQYRLDLRLIDARLSRVVGSQGAFIAGGDAKLGDPTVQMVRKLLGTRSCARRTRWRPRPGSARRPRRSCPRARRRMWPSAGWARRARCRRVRPWWGTPATSGR